ncbi:MAG: winged helix-turn-helix domain-containing protein, partial [Azovibrio sp.]
HQQGGQPLDLSDTEFRLLQVLLENPNTVLNRERLLQLTCRQDSEVFDRSIDSQISRLRRKFSDDAKNPRLLRTIWGNGYILTTDVSRSTMS